jgi:DNA-directed RNA polymerase specialized sigma24 family protein
VMHYFLGMPLPDVARTLGVPLGTAKSRLHRSLRAMRLKIGTDETSDVSPLPGGQFA